MQPRRLEGSKKNTWGCLFLLVLLGQSVPAFAAGEIQWYQNLKEASEVAQERNLPMFIDFWADWCAPCKIMDAEVYSDATVIQAFQTKIIGVRLHYDLQPDVVRKYNVPALPYLVFTTSYGTPLVHHRGFLEAEDLAKVVEAIPPLAEINQLDRDLQTDKDNFGNLFAMARTLRAAGFYEASNGYYDRASRQKAARADAARRETILFDMAMNTLELQDGKQAATRLEKTLKEFPKSPRKPEMLVALGRAYALDEKTDKAIRTLNAIISEYPQTPAAAEAQAILTSF
jgi:thioredoxin-like negative regulator of GroEL